MSEIPVGKFYWFQHTFKVEQHLLSRYKQKSKNISNYQTTNLLKIWFFFLVSAKGQKRDTSKFVNKFAEVIILKNKNVSLILCEIFAHSVSSLIPKNTKP